MVKRIITEGRLTHLIDHIELLERLISITDFTTPQEAVDYVAAAGGGKLSIPRGIFDIGNLSVPAGVSLIGQGVFATKLRGSIIASGEWQWQTFSDFAISHSNTTGAGNDLIRIQYGITHTEIKNIFFGGYIGVTRDGIRIDGENPTGGANNTFYNIFSNLKFYGNDKINGVALNLAGTYNNGVGADTFVDCSFYRWGKYIYVYGMANTFMNCLFDPNYTDCGVHLDTVNSMSNKFINCWWDGPGANWVGPLVKLSNSIQKGDYILNPSFDGTMGVKDISRCYVEGTRQDLITPKFY